MRIRDDGGHLTQLAKDPVGYTWSVGEIARLIRNHDPNRRRADRIVLDLYRRKCLRLYSPGRWDVRYSEARRHEWLAAHAEFVAEHIPEDLESILKPPYRARSAAIRTGDLAIVDANCAAEAALDAS